MSIGYLVTRSNPVEDRVFFETLEEGLGRVREAMDYRFDLETNEEGASNLTRHVYFEQKERAILTVADDYETPVRYLFVEAMTDEEVQRVLGLLAHHVAFYSLAELQDAAEEFRGGGEDLTRLAVGSGPLRNSRTMDIFRRGFCHPEPKIRDAALCAAFIPHWDELLPDIEARRAVESDEYVRRVIDFVLTQWPRREVGIAEETQ